MFFIFEKNENADNAIKRQRLREEIQEKEDITGVVNCFFFLPSFFFYLVFLENEFESDSKYTYGPPSCLLLSLRLVIDLIGSARSDLSAP